MLGFNAYHLEEVVAHLAAAGRGYDVQALRVAQRRYDQAVLWARAGRLLAALRREPNRLLDLSEVEASMAVRGRFYAGAQVVPIHQIKGSEGRCADFDRTFRPLRPHSRERWIRLAVAWQLGQAMQAIELIRVGDLHFVRDGHHRISVARAFGQQYVDAVVTVWQVDGALPWEPASERRAWCPVSASS